MDKKSFVSNFARAMATNFSKVWLKLNWPQPSSRVFHLSCDHVIFGKRCIWSLTIDQSQWPLTLVGLWVRVKGPHLLFQVAYWSRDQVLFEKRHVYTNDRPQNSAGDIKHRKTHKWKAFFVCYSNDINIWLTSIHTTLKIFKLCR